MAEEEPRWRPQLLHDGGAGGGRDGSERSGSGSAIDGDDADEEGHDGRRRMRCCCCYYDANGKKMGLVLEDCRPQEGRIDLPGDGAAGTRRVVDRI